MSESHARLQRLAHALHAQGSAWRLSPGVEAFQALRGGPCTVAVTLGAARGALTRFANPRDLRKVMGLRPADHSAGEHRRQGSMTQAGNPHARRVLVDGAWADRYPAQVSRPLPLRLEKPPKVIQAISWQAQVRLGKRYRRLVARGQPANVVTVAIARARTGCLWAMAQEGPSAV